MQRIQQLFSILLKGICTKYRFLFVHLLLLTDDHNSIIGRDKPSPDYSLHARGPHSGIVETLHNSPVNEKVSNCNIMQEGCPLHW